MKFCLSSNQVKEYLTKCDEIFVNWKNRESLFEMAHDYPDKSFVLSIEDIKPEDWQRIEQYNKALKNRFKLCISIMDDMIQAQKRDISFFPKTPINTYEMLHSVIALGAKEVRVCGELGHDIDNLKDFPITLRIMPNKAIVPLAITALFGTWVRPEDIHIFPEGTIIEFDEQPVRREQALFRIYSQREQWNGDLNLLVDDADGSMDNLLSKLFPDNFQERRNNCRLQCLRRTNSCHWCETCANAATKNFAEKIKELYVDNNK